MKAKTRDLSRIKPNILFHDINTVQAFKPTTPHKGYDRDMVSKNISFSLNPTLLKRFKNIVKIRGLPSDSEAARRAITEFCEREEKKVPIIRIIQDLADGKIPEFLKENKLDYRKTEDLKKLEQILMQENE